MSDETKQKIRQMMREVGELESIADACYNLSRTLNRRMQSGKTFTIVQTNDILEMMGLCDQALEQMCLVLHEQLEEHNINETYRIENKIDAMCERLKEDNLEAVNEHRYDYSLGTMFSDMVSEMEHLGDYVVNVAQARFGQ